MTTRASFSVNQFGEVVFTRGDDMRIFRTSKGGNYVSQRFPNGETCQVCELLLHRGNALTLDGKDLITVVRSEWKKCKAAYKKYF